MKPNMTWAMTLIAILGLVAMGGCGTPSGTAGASKVTAGADETKPIADIKAEIAKMNPQQIKEAAMKYKMAIEAKRGDLTTLAEKIKKTPPAAISGPESDRLKTELETITKSVAALYERLNVYMDKLKELKVDTTDLKL
jgi:chromosome segregation ATPase